MESWSGVKIGVKFGGDFGMEFGEKFGVIYFFWWVLGVNGLFH